MVHSTSRRLPDFHNVDSCYSLCRAQVPTRTTDLRTKTRSCSNRWDLLMALKRKWVYVSVASHWKCFRLLFSYGLPRFVLQLIVNSSQIFEKKIEVKIPQLPNTGDLMFVRLQCWFELGYSVWLRYYFWSISDQGKLRIKFCVSSFQIDMNQVNLSTIKPWINKKITEYLNFEDDVVIEFIYNQLDVRVSCWAWVT